MPICQRCGQPLRQGQAVCVACGTPTGMRVVQKPTGIGCIPLVVGLFVVSAVIVGLVVGLLATR